MTEVSFARSFLSALDARPIKISADHVEDPRNYPARAAYTLPKMPRPMSKPNSSRPGADGSASSTQPAPGSERSYTVQLVFVRNPPLDITLLAQSINTSVLDLKTAVVNKTGLPLDKIKLLHNKKPVADSKILKDVLGAEAAASATKVEFGIMVMGGAATLAAAEAAKNAGAGGGDVAQGPSGEEVLETAEFWDDLRGFLLQRIRDEKAAGELADTFQAAWKSKR
ncbi:cell-cycle control medial ring component-domain-containing protein [Microdochium trichocladiopsis]|uniref:Cell-cycle control medial ring component-domain-containing protein n=1 Tax=Microdochium trichocladiopsis TaxID=1682393 RepID=A0A9P8Y288_9PEZI|nr:cell-cycle control medial ring component-domain-containing protein [Microdochium trichocladiopsis]KAH7027855.1 cell-cycle control medial ring component-domain-containing protein [Microdochium trichocladiopsis]